MTKCGDLGEISTRNLQVGEIDLKEHTYHKYIATMHSAAACIYSEFSKFGLHAYF